MTSLASRPCWVGSADSPPTRCSRTPGSAWSGPRRCRRWAASTKPTTGSRPPSGPTVSTAPAGSSATTAGIAGGRAINHYFAGDAAGIRAAVAPALELDTDGSDYWKSALLTTLGIATYVEGHEADAAALLEEAVRAGVASDHTLALIHALGWCAIVHYGRGESEQGDRVVDQTESLLQARPGMTAYYGAAMAHLARGAKHEHEGRISEAESEVARAVGLARRGDAKFEVVLGLAAHTRLKGQLGDRPGAKGLLGEARQAISECVDPGVLPSLVATVERELRLAPRQPTQAIYAEDLSERELAVLRLLPSDLTQREISSHLYVSFNTVKTHNKSIFQKLGVSTRPRGGSSCAGARSALTPQCLVRSGWRRRSPRPRRGARRGSRAASGSPCRRPRPS